MRVAQSAAFFQLDRRNQTPANFRMMPLDQQRQRIVGQWPLQPPDQQSPDHYDQRDADGGQQNGSRRTRHFRAT